MNEETMNIVTFALFVLPFGLAIWIGVVMVIINIYKEYK